jgi:hypothetical protein
MEDHTTSANGEEKRERNDKAVGVPKNEVDGGKETA